MSAVTCEIPEILPLLGGDDSLQDSDVAAYLTWLLACTSGTLRPLQRQAGTASG